MFNSLNPVLCSLTTRSQRSRHDLPLLGMESLKSPLTKGWCTTRKSHHGPPVNHGNRDTKRRYQNHVTCVSFRVVYEQLPSHSLSRVTSPTLTPDLVRPHPRPPLPDSRVPVRRIIASGTPRDPFRPPQTSDRDDRPTPRRGRRTDTNSTHPPPPRNGGHLERRLVPNPSPSSLLSSIP